MKSKVLIIIKDGNVDSVITNSESTEVTIQDWDSARRFENHAQNNFADIHYTTQVVSDEELEEIVYNNFSEVSDLIDERKNES